MSIQTHFQESKHNLRPILTSLNGDNSWLISIPRPVNERKTTGKAYYHIVHDPWLNGPVTEGSSWLIHISTSAAPTVSDGTGVEGMVQHIENLATEAGLISPRSTSSDDQNSSLIDLISMNFHYSDHLHKPTLLTFNSSIPVLATSEAAAVIKPWKHFTHIITSKDIDPSSFTGDWTTLHPGSPLPSWLTRFRILGHHELNFVSAMFWTSAPDVHEAILYSPHGIHISQPSLQTFLHNSFPKFSTLALLHGLKESWAFVWWQNTFGAKSGLELYRQSEARYWVLTHEDKLKYAGVLWYIANDVFRTLEWALSGEKEGGGKDGREVDIREVKNGGSLVLT